MPAERERERKSNREGDRKRERAWVSSFSHVVCNVVAQLLCRKSGQRAERIGMWMSSRCRGRGIAGRRGGATVCKTMKLTDY